MSEQPIVYWVDPVVCGEHHTETRSRPVVTKHDYDTLQAKVRELEQKLAGWELAATQGHPRPCTLGPLCPYCRIRNLEEQLEMREQQAIVREPLIVGQHERITKLEQQVHDLRAENTRLDRELDYARKVTIPDLEGKLSAYDGGALHDQLVSQQQYITKLTQERDLWEHRAQEAEQAYFAYTDDLRVLANERDQLRERVNQLLVRDWKWVPDELNALATRVRELEHELKEICELLGCHRAYIKHTIEDLTERADSIPSADQYRKLEQQVTDLEGKLTQSEELIKEYRIGGASDGTTNLDQNQAE